MIISKDSLILKGFLIEKEDILLSEIKSILRNNYWREISTPSGKKMSIKISNCGDFGWYSDKKGYRYSKVDPLSDEKWLPIPDMLKNHAIEAAKRAGYNNFNPDCCLMNRYEIGTKLSLHQDIDEKDFSHPIVSFSFGLPANFLFGGQKRENKFEKYLLENGDVLVFGGNDRLRYHGIETIKESDDHFKIGNIRINLTFRMSN